MLYHSTGYLITLADKKIYVSSPDESDQTIFGVITDSDELKIMLTVYHLENAKVKEKVGNTEAFVDLDKVHLYNFLDRIF